MSNRAGAVFLGLMMAAAAGQAQGQTAAPAAAAPALLAPGTPAPNVSLVINGRTMSLKSLLAGNRTAVLFFPANCSSCDSQLQAVDKGTLQALGKLGVAVFAVSPDAPAAQAGTVSRLSLLYKVLSDPNGAAAAKFHVTDSAAFLIDRDGTVRYASQTPLSGSGLVAAASNFRKSSRAAP